MCGAATGASLAGMQAFRLVRDRAQRCPWWLVDGALVLLVAAARVIQYDLNEDGHAPPVAGELFLPIALLAALPLALRRRFPFGVLLAAGAGELTLLVLDLHASPFALLIATYTVAAYRSQVESLAALAVVLIGTAVAVVAVEGPTLVLEATVALAMAWALGALQNARGRYAAEVERRLEVLEREREAQAQLASSEERSRIARELHDVVAHGVSVMVMQAAGARRSLRADPGRADAAMAEVEQTGRRSLAEMRRLLGVLEPESQPAELAPQPGLDRLDELLERFRRAELPVELRVDGERRKLPSDVDLSAFRIIQEALTNVLKHAGHVPVTVTLHYRDDSLGLQIIDRGNGRVADSMSSRAGRGLIGMRERVALVGGSLTAAPDPEGGFHVECDLPLSGA
jgi:signal transduction histidine kinase